MNEFAVSHTDRVRSVIEGRNQLAAAKSRFPFDSWARCGGKYQLSPGTSQSIPIVDRIEVLAARDRLSEKLALASEELDFLHSIVGRSQYVVTLANADGMTLALRANRIDHRHGHVFSELGRIWDEKFAGTNGIGTCLHYGKPTSVFKDEHFYSDYIYNGCAAVPLFAPDGDCDVWGAVNISVTNPDLERDTHNMALEALKSCVSRLSETIFRHAYRDIPVVRLQQANGASALFALDEDFAIRGADFGARQKFEVKPGDSNSRSFWHHFHDCRDAFLRLDNAPSLQKFKSLSGQDFRGTIFPPLNGNRPAIRAAKQSVSERKPVVEKRVSLSEWAGSESSLTRSITILRKLMPTRLPVLVLGETGVGKDTLARAYHAESQRADEAFVALNCASIPETLIESELFGYAGGAFTGARKDGSVGLVSRAHKGTLFLDEIGDMPLALQPRLLRFLETGEVAPLGSGKVSYVDVQIVAATNQRLEEAVETGRFREDLYHRLAGVVIDVPALRDRSDKPAVIWRAITSSTQGTGIEVSQAALSELLSYRWPGNIRELYLVLKRATAIATGGVIDAPDLMLRTFARQASIPETQSLTSQKAGASAPAPHPFKRPDRNDILEAVRASKDMKSAAAQLGMSKATLYRRLTEYGVDRRSLSEGPSRKTEA